MLNFVYGMITMGFLAVAVFFFRFWRRTGDGLFAIFGISFALFALNQALTALLGLPRDEQSLLYLLRLSAFVLLIIAIWRKNFSRSHDAG
jgi:hypothetical protein